MQVQDRLGNCEYQSRHPRDTGGSARCTFLIALARIRFVCTLCTSMRAQGTCDKLWSCGCGVLSPSVRMPGARASTCRVPGKGPLAERAWVKKDVETDQTGNDQGCSTSADTVRCGQLCCSDFPDSDHPYSGLVRSFHFFFQVQ